MIDDARFEGRLSEALARYADRGPVDVDPVAMTAAVHGAVQPGRRPAFAFARPAVAVALLLVALAAAVVIVGALLNGRQLPLPGGGIFLWSGAWHGEGNAYVVGADGRAIQSASLTGIRHCPHVIGDGRSIAYWAEDGTLRLVSVGATQATSRVLATFSFRVVAADIWSDDGRWIATREFNQDRPSGVVVVSTDDGSTSLIASSANGRVVGVAWAPRADRLVLARQLSLEISIETVNRDGSDLRSLARLPFDSGSGGYPELIWSSDGGRIGVAAPAGGPLVVLDAVTGRAAEASGEPRFMTSVRSRVAWVSPDGSRIARFDVRDLVITDVAGHELVRQRLGAPAHALAWSPDSKALAVSHASTGDSVWFDVFSAAGDRPPTTLGPFAGTFEDPICIAWLGS